MTSIVKALNPGLGDCSVFYEPLCQGLRKRVGPKEDLIDPKTSPLSIIKQDFSLNVFPPAMDCKVE